MWHCSIVAWYVGGMPIAGAGAGGFKEVHTCDTS